MRITGLRSRATAALGAAALLTFCTFWLASGAGAAATATDDELAAMSLEDLMDVTVTSASKREETRFDVAAAITVLTEEDIRRSGATSIPEALRMVPGLQVGRINSSRYAISGRGFNSRFANKLLVMIDGRSVYTPLFGGVEWDIQDVPLSDIDRIEVIRGPGGTQWGANAVNGVINIITKNANETQGALVDVMGGSQQFGGDARYGAKLGDTAFRAWARGMNHQDQMIPGPTFSAQDAWWQTRVGTRVDSQLTPDDTLMMTTGYYDGEAEDVPTLLGAPLPQTEGDLIGGHVLARWGHAFSESSRTQLQVYYDRNDREALVDEQRDTADVDFQHNFALGESWLVDWGLGYRYTHDDTESGAIVGFAPADEDLHLGGGFGQLRYTALEGALALTGGMKLEYNNFTDFEYQPTARAVWKFAENNAVWAAFSRAVRTPARSDRQVFFTVFQVGNGGVDSEKLLAYEFGYRNTMFDRVTFDLAGFYNDYHDLVALNGATTSFANAAEAQTWGGEVELGWQPADFARITLGYAYLRLKEQFAAGFINIFGNNETSNPEHSVVLRTWLNLPFDTQLDTALYWVDDVRGQVDANGNTIADYFRFDVRLAWQPLEWMALELVGQNLTEDHHAEFGDILTQPTDVPRSYYGRARVTF